MIKKGEIVERLRELAKQAPVTDAAGNPNYAQTLHDVQTKLMDLVVEILH